MDSRPWYNGLKFTQNPAYVPGGTQPANIIAVGNYKPSSGGYDVKEGFAEVAVPIFKDSPIGRSLNFNAAIRATDYSTSGWVTTWKAGLVYYVVGGIKLRGTFSRDIRAPNLNEYFLGGQPTSQQVRDPANNNVNIFKKAPPISPTTTTQLQTSIGRAAATYDLVGRFFRVGLRFDM